MNITENNYFLTSLMVINAQDESNEDYFNDGKYSYDEEDEKEEEEEEEEEKEEKKDHNSDRKYIENKIVKHISIDYLELLKQLDLSSIKNYDNNLCLSYKIPGLFNLYQDINSYIKCN